MQAYVTVPDSLWNNMKDLENYLAQSYDYAKTLKPTHQEKTMTGPLAAPGAVVA
jgi:hypothetical protein